MSWQVAGHPAPTKDKPPSLAASHHLLSQPIILLPNCTKASQGMNYCRSFTMHLQMHLFTSILFLYPPVFRRREPSHCPRPSVHLWSWPPSSCKPCSGECVPCFLPPPPFLTAGSSPSAYQEGLGFSHSKHLHLTLSFLSSTTSSFLLNKLWKD